jgi:hypothetical protein
MNEVERLYYYNGRRLEAPDLQLEQSYHLEMRRLLNRDLFTAGVVAGLEVTAADLPNGKKSKTRVAVAEGLALDPHGREIVHPGGEIDVPAQPPTTNLKGYFLVISYDERRIPADEDPCLEPGTAAAARVRETPKLDWMEQLPNHDDCRRGDGTALDCAVALAFVPMSTACEIEGVELSVREYSHPTHASQVSAIALEGEKDIDKDNPKELRFAIRGGAPSSVLLYLWGGKFSSLFYTEMGQHAHTLSNVQVGSITTSLAAHTHSLSNHTHTIPGTTTGDGGGHGHDLYVDKAGFDPDPPVVGREGTVSTHQNATQRINLFDPPRDSEWHSEYATKGGQGKNYIQGVGNHSHSVSVGPTAGASPDVTGPASAPQGSETHTPTFSATIDPAGSPTYNVRGGPAYEYVDGMRVALDGIDITNDILAVLKRRLGWGDTPQLGNGKEDHVFVKEGTDSIDLLTIATSHNIDMSREKHSLTFSVKGGGGKVLYNLFVE